MTRILVVEDSRTQALEIQLLLEEAGFEVTLAGNGLEGLAALKQGLPDVVLTDLQMPQMNGLELVEAVRQEYPGVPVVLMTAMGSEEIAVQALQKGASSYVPKRNLARDILPTLEHVLTVAQAGKQEKRVLDCLSAAEFAFVLDNDTGLVGPLIGHLEESVARIQGCDRTELMRVGIALHEALVNAIQHGNLEVSSELRQEDDDRYRQLSQDRRRLEPYRDRRVHVRARLTPAESVYVVRDDGPGFDPSDLPDPTDPANLERIGGRGLMLIRTFMDRVEFNDRGNEITMTKRGSRPAPGAAP
jgi:CheY-like chemotaxis protein/anti-sigma regulatory factor (Ser/Thr protein kinase)